MINFFDERCQQITTEKHFGLIDSEEKTPAEISAVNPENWIAIISNEEQKEVTFTAIDNCIEILRADGNTESRCDCLLQCNDNLDFIELKEVSKNWITSGIKQLQKTITIFSENYELTVFKRKRAFLANRKHPNFQYSHKEVMQKFKNETKFRLIICNEIKI